MDGRGSNRSKEGYSKIKMTIRKEMVMDLHVTRRLPFSLADSAFAFACNNRNNLSVHWMLLSLLQKQ